MMKMRKLLLAFTAAIVLSVSLNACGKKLPDPVVRKDGYAWIPIADTAFLVPEKTWLKGYGRRSTDGSIDSFNLHVTAPDVQPWSEAVNQQMYPPLGPGKMVRVEVRDIGENYDYLSRRFHQVPQSRWGHSRSLKETISDLEADGLRKFLDPSWTRTVFYERIENDRVKYFIHCDEDKDPPNRQFCHLSFPWGKGVFVELVFTRNYLPHSVRMADQIAAKLKEFEAAGHAYQRTAGTEQ